jgi:PAS domain S-box-containing protein
MLQRISLTAASELDLARLESIILDEVTQTVHIARAALFLRQEEGGEYRLMAHRGLKPDVDIRLRSDHPLVEWLSEQDHALSRYEMDLIPQFKALWGHELGNLQELGAELCIPLKTKGELVGILTFGPRLSEEAYSQDDLLTLTTLANQTATALENARLHEETRRRYDELALLNRVISTSADSRGTESLLRTVCRELASTLGEVQTAAVLLNEEQTEATIVTGGDSAGSASRHQDVGLVALLASGGSWPSSHTGPIEDHLVLPCLLEHGTPLVMDDAWTDPRLAPILDEVQRYGIASLLSLPLLMEGEHLGLICLAATKPRPFTTDEVDLAQSVAEQVCGALARARLAEAQQRLSAAIEQAAEAVMITDIDGTIQYVNPAFEHVSGYTHAELIGRHLGVFGDDEADNSLNRQLQESMRTGQEWQGRVVSRRKEGESYTGDTTITPVRNQAGEIVNYVATLRDVTRELQLEEQFRQSHKMEALGRLAGGIAHDFNNLLTVIQLSSRFAERKLSPEDPVWEHLKRIDETGERAAKLTRQLLSFSRREVIAPQVVDLNQLVSDLNRMLQRIIGEDIEYSLSLGQDLWQVKVDPSQMEQVILNLVVNARDAMPQGGALRIETTSTMLHEARRTRHFEAQPGEYVMLAVSDTGVGMDEEVMTHLFEPFFTTKEREHGTGLGMSTVFGIVKQSEGHIEVESEVQRGTTFRIYLPRAVDGAVATADRIAPASATGGQETILVVEDEPQVRQLTVECLQTLGYTVLVASGGLQALRVSRGHDGPIQLLLTDVVMPQLSGRELVEQLLPERPEMRVLYMSGHTDRLVVKQVSSDPNVAFLSKPFTVESLSQKVQSVLRDSRPGPIPTTV